MFIYIRLLFSLLRLCAAIYAFTDRNSMTGRSYINNGPLQCMETFKKRKLSKTKIPLDVPYLFLIDAKQTNGSSIY